MSEQELYIPYPELPDVSTGSSPYIYYVKEGNGNIISLQFDDGKLDDASLYLKQQATPEVRHTIELLEKKLLEEEMTGVEDEASDDESKQPFDPSSISIENVNSVSCKNINNFL